MTMYTFGFSRIIFDKTVIEALGYCFFQFGELRATNGNVSPLTFSTSPFFANNFLMGMKSFHVNGPNKIKFDTTIAATTSVSSNIAFTYLSFMYWSFKKRVCPVGYPYFQVSTLLCFDVCPGGMYGDNATMMCLACNYMCLTCSSFNVCTNCDPATNRYQNGTTCPPNPGYFDNSTADAVACNAVLPQCLACADNVTCTNCSSGTYIAANGSCQFCNASITNCTACSMPSTVLCDTCATGYSLSADKLSCTFNPCIDTNCATCSLNISVC